MRSHIFLHYKDYMLYRRLTSMSIPYLCMQLFCSRSSSPQKEPRESGLGLGSEDECKREGEGEEEGHAQRRSIHYARLGRSSLHSNPLAGGGRRSITSATPITVVTTDTADVDSEGAAEEGAE